MRRRTMNPARDRRVYRETADRTKAINLYPILTRGGFRL